MKKVDLIAKAIFSDITDKNILEVACGCAEFSISAASYAHTVACIDIETHRVPV